MLFTNASIYATLLTMSHEGLQLLLDKHADHTGGKFISKQTLMKVTYSGTTIKGDFNCTN